MTTTVIITTFAKDHIDIYGTKFMQSLNKFCNIPITLYGESFYRSDLPGNYCMQNFEDTIPEHKDFVRYIKSSIGTDKKETNRLQKALRWSYKSFVIIHALKFIPADLIVWLDGDVVATNPISNNFFESINKNFLCTVYPQIIYNNLHIESGLVIFNKKHFFMDDLIQHYIEGYYEKKILSLKKPWDGFWLGDFVDKNKSKNICQRITPPFSNVSDYLRHNVGKQKFINTHLNKYSGRTLDFPL